jgi:hypothetical protein
VQDYRSGIRSGPGLETPRIDFIAGSKSSYNPKTGYFRKLGVFDFEEISSRYDLRSLASKASGHFSPEVVDSFIPEPEINLEFKRTMIALRLWEETPGDKLITKEEVFRNQLIGGPEYTDLLKDKWEYGIRASHRFIVAQRSYREWEEVKHYNALPTIAHLINWRTSPDDIKYMADQVSIDSNLLEEFEEELESLLPDDLAIPADAEVFSQSKNSVSYDQSKGKTIPFWKARLTPEGSMFSTNFRGYRCIVPVAAGNTRDTVVVPIDVYNTVKWCDLVIRNILDECPESLINSNPSITNSRLRNASTTKLGSYFLRDIKKCGLTFPRELFHSVQKILTRMYPDKDFKRFDLYRYYTVYDQGQSIPCNRGYCLGMANNLVTLCQVVCYRMLRNRIPSSILTKYWCGNDDSLLFIEGRVVEEELMMIVESEDDEITQGLGIVKHESKSFWSMYPIIFEEYGHDRFKSKDSRFAMALAPCFLVDDIKIAKRICNALSPLIEELGSSALPYLRRLINHWGYDYYPEESRYDYLLGGWISKSKRGCSLILRDIEEASPEIIPMMHLAMMKAVSFEKGIAPSDKDLEGCYDNMSPLGRSIGLRFLKETLELPDFLPRESLILSKQEYARFYDRVFTLSRRPWLSFQSSFKKVNKIRLNPDIDREYLYKVAGDLVDRPLAIPKSFVLGETYLFDTFESLEVPGRFFQNQLSSYLEWARRRNFIFSNPVHEWERPLDSLIQVHQVPRGIDTSRYLHKNGRPPEGVYQFSRNPNIPLSEYVSEYGTLPIGFIPFCKEFAIIPERAYTYSPRSEREAIFILTIKDEVLLDIVLSELREAPIEIQDDNESEPDLEYILESDPCEDHKTSLIAGWSDGFEIFTMRTEVCSLCRLHRRLWALETSLRSVDTGQYVQKKSELDCARQDLEAYARLLHPDLASSLNYLLGIEEEDEFSDGLGLF